MRGLSLIITHSIRQVWLTVLGRRVVNLTKLMYCISSLNTILRFDHIKRILAYLFITLISESNKECVQRRPSSGHHVWVPLVHTHPAPPAGRVRVVVGLRDANTKYRCSKWYQHYNRLQVDPTLAAGGSRG